MIYEHVCRACLHEWEEDYPLGVEELKVCPHCGGVNTYRCVTTSGAVHFKGPGWSPTGYNKHTAYDAYGKDKLKIYDRKEDLDRDMRGEARAAELTKQKRLNEVAKKTLGVDAAVTQNQADAAVKKAGEDAVK